MAAEAVAPDYTLGCGRMGGHLHEVVPQPPLRKWPAALEQCGIKRAVRVQVAKFYGIGQHFYVSLTEEDNPVWQSKIDPPYTTESHWVKPWEDREGRGRIESKRCYTLGGVDNFINRTMTKYFPPETHEIQHADEQELRQQNGRWHYNEGD